jgi:small-conductance mechanosensitive channel
MAILLATLLFTHLASAQDPAVAAGEYQVAPVTLDGHTLFSVRGISALPAEERAAGISQRIKATASDANISQDSIRLLSGEHYSSIIAGSVTLMEIYDADAAVEGVTRSVLAESTRRKLTMAIGQYRFERSRPALLKKAARALVATVLLVLILVAIVFAVRRLNRYIQQKIEQKIRSVESISFKLIKSKQMWKVFHLLFDTLKVIVVFIALVFYFQYVLGLFPWTNALSADILDLFLQPVFEIGNGFINYLPKLVFLIVFYYLTKYVLRLVRLFFTGIEDGDITFRDFKPEWAMSTYKIVRVIIISFMVIVAYPYIPGSDSVAFKGVSVFVGVLFSLGSSSFIGNIIAGYSMIYRGAFKKGDRIAVGDQVGIVEEQKLMVTRLRSLKNEEIVVPNSILLNSNIINYSAKSRESGLILHVTVGIGYETPWRQVDAMLKLAATRTDGLLREPAPFVLKKALGDFAVTYEINAYCKEIDNLNSTYTRLYQNILDVFNENNVQIMTPNYVNDTEVPKIVPRDQWDIPLTGEE